MKKFIRTVFIQVNLFVFTILPIVFLCLILVSPVWEDAWCGEHECHTIQHHIIYSREEFKNVPLTNKEKIEITEVKDNLLNISTYYLGTHEKIFNKYKNTYVDKNRYVFEAGYISKKNAERDMNIIKNNDNIHVIKKNAGLITILLSIIYIILMSFGILNNMIQREIKENNLRNDDTRKN